ncbi:hypothetical protein DUNSADRAFT_8103 [Dunaliella salina]|uniref:Encoded protein n=1 Tax=Dunaliella salina TaxID=3046 RepID=A0ABQ7GK50_DUNSA|nr:hypothetical protein DUNSADRAFT_8103 [Dunaliella salina]|eukprot:KAF5834954.1 hypothetical protein DUNSADRAFT_8103 [Dunaliella salina]
METWYLPLSFSSLGKPPSAVLDSEHLQVRTASTALWRAPPALVHSEHLQECTLSRALADLSFCNLSIRWTGSSHRTPCRPPPIIVA